MTPVASEENLWNAYAGYCILCCQQKLSPVSFDVWEGMLTGELKEDKLTIANREIERLNRALRHIGFFCAGTEFNNVSEYTLKVFKGEEPTL